MRRLLALSLLLSSATVAGAQVSSPPIVIMGKSSGGTGGAVSSVFGRTGAVTAQSGDYTVGQVTGAAPLASPALTGTPTAPTATTGDNSTTIATTAFVKAQAYGQGTVTNVASGAGLTGGPITTTGTLSLTEAMGNSGAPVTGTTYTVNLTPPGDLATEIVFTGSSGSAWTIGAGAAGEGFDIVNQGTANVTGTFSGNIISCSGSTCSSAATMVVAPGTFANVFYDGSTGTWRGALSQIGSASGVSSITGTANQITTSASTGAVTLSLPAAVQTTSLALNGATIGANALAATGSINASTTVTAGTNLIAAATGTIGFTGRAVVSSPAAGDFQIGGTNGTTPVAYTLGFQNGAGTNIAGQNTTIVASVGSGNAAQGNMLLQVGQPTTSGAGYGTALTGVNIVGGTAQVRLPNIAADTALTDTSVCADTTNKGLFTGTGTAGICLGNVSSRRFKTKINYIPDGLTTIMELKPADWFYKPGFGDNGARQQVGFIAEDFVAALPKLTRYDAQGKPNGTDILGTVPYLVRAIQQQQQEINELWAALAAVFLFTCGGFVWVGRGR